MNLKNIYYVYVVYNINGDIIGVADSYDNAEKILEKRYIDYEDLLKQEGFNKYIQKFKLNELYYA